jgi:hypothetical protein
MTASRDRVARAVRAAIVLADHEDRQQLSRE